MCQDFPISKISNLLVGCDHPKPSKSLSSPMTIVVWNLPSTLGHVGQKARLLTALDNFDLTHILSLEKKNGASHLRPKLNHFKMILLITRHQDSISSTIEFLDPKWMSHEQSKKKTKKIREQKRKFDYSILHLRHRINPTKKKVSKKEILELFIMKIQNSSRNCSLVE